MNRNIIKILACGLLSFSLTSIPAQKNKDEIISKAIREEVERGLAGLKLENLQRPFFISYTLGDFKNLSISATLGSIVNSEYSPMRASNARLLIGDYQCTDENFSGSSGGGSGYDGMPCFENDEKGIRYTIWKDLDAIYKRAAETYEQKISAIKQLNIPQKELDLPDWDKTPTIVMNDIPSKQIDFDKAKYEEYLKQASTVFSKYKEIFDSGVYLYIISSELYFYNTEKTSYQLPMFYISLNANASTMNDEGENISAYFRHSYMEAKELPSLEELKKKCEALAEKVLMKKKAPVIDEAYTGPVLYEGQAAAETFYSNFTSGSNSLIARRKPISASGYSYGGNSIEEMIDKRITSREITIEDLTGSKEYNGKPLMGYFPVDAEGVIPPEKLVLVENGILKTLLNDRVPTQKVPHSNGHSLPSLRMGASTSPGVLRMQYNGTQDIQAMRQELLKRAKEEGYDYAYIVREVSPLSVYKLNADGSEQLVRSATIKNMDSQAFKRIVSASDKEFIYDTVSGNLTTVIVPNAILFEELQIQKNATDNYQKPPIVPHPNTIN